MVRLWRGAAPPLLREHRAEWTDRWAEITAGRRAGSWAQAAAKKVFSDELRTLAFGKCAFCESLLGVDTYLEAEHYVAKTVRPELAFEWKNLFPVCRLCNGAKRNTDHEGRLIKPDTGDPERLFWLHPDTGRLEARAKRGTAARRRVERTLELCDLQRGPLCTKRIEKMEFTIHWLERMVKLDGCLDQPLVEEWNRLIDPAAEYKFVIRHVFEIRGEPELAEKDRSRFRMAAFANRRPRSSKFRRRIRAS
jgi:uncharacterized protein (TIGR02646 family)